MIRVAIPAQRAHIDSGPIASRLSRLAWFVLLAVAAWTILATWVLNLGSALGWSLPVIAIATAGAAATLTAVLWGARVLERQLEPFRAATALGPAAWLLTSIAIGLAGRIAWALVAQPPLLSDHATYFQLAERLYTEGIYEDPRGDRAYWPPGYPLFLLVSFAMTGVRPWVPLAANLILFVATSLATYGIGRLALGEREARTAVLLLAIWPNHVLSAALASKELLAAALLPLSLLLYIQATVPAQRRIAVAPRLLASGLLLGAASLAQPSIMLFPAFLAAHALLRPDRLSVGVRQIAVVALATVALIAPWTARNWLVLGAFVPVSTNGGDVFYRANNPEATGGYIPVGQRPLLHLSEAERNRAGYRSGFDWISSHPREFLALAVRKQALFLADDSNGAYETLKRGRAPDPRLYTAAKGLSNVWWLGIWALILLALRLRPDVYRRPSVLLIASPFLYLLAVDSVFEAGARHHVPAVAFLAILASGSAVPLADRAGALLGLPGGDDASLRPRRRKIVFLSGVMSGDNPRALLLMNSLAAAGYEVVAILAQARATGQSAPDAIRHHPLPPPRANFLGNSSLPSLLRAFGDRARNAFSMYRLAVAERPDACICHEPDSWLVGLLLKLRVGTCLLVDLREVYGDRVQSFPRALRRLAASVTHRSIRFLARRSDGIIHVSGYRAQHYRLPTAPSVIVHHRCDPGLFAGVDPKRPPELRDRLVFLHAGPLRLNYAARELLIALESLPSSAPDLSLLVIGGAFGVEPLRPLLDRLRQRGRLVLLPYLPRREVAAHMKGADCGVALVLPVDATHRLASPTKLYEYLEAGLPVIGSDVPEIRDVLTDHQCGLLVDATNPDEVAAAFARLAGDHSLRRTLASNARTAAAALSWSDDRQRLLEFVARRLHETRRHRHWR